MFADDERAGDRAGGALRNVDAKRAPPPSRIESVRAGAIFTFYWQYYRAGALPGRTPSAAERASFEAPMAAVFRNPRFTLNDVVAAYQRGEGSNAVLQRGMEGQPDHVFRWFRIGQVASYLPVSAQQASDSEFQLQKVALRGNLASGNVSAADIDAMVQQAEAMRGMKVSPENAAQVTSALSRYQELYCQAAAKQDSYADFEAKCIRQGGVFVSYAHSDAELVRELGALLDGAGISHWLDEQEAVAGTGVRATLAEAVAANCVFLVVLSPQSVLSPWVQFELEMARAAADRGTHVLVPLLAGGLKPPQLPAELRAVIAVDLAPGLTSAFPALQRAITSHLVALERRRTMAAAPG
jgi:hypothetical protein